MFGIGLALPAVTSGFSFGSFATYATIASIGSTIVGTYQGYQQSLINARNFRVGAAYDRQRVDIARKQEIIKANNAARKLASEKRATIGARGGKIATGSTLLDQQGVYEELEDALFWINQGYSFELASIDAELEGALQQEAYKRRTSLIGGVAQVALTSALGDFSGFRSSSQPTIKSQPPTPMARPASVGGSFAPNAPQINTAGNIKLNRAVNPMFVGQTSPISGGVYNTAGGGMT
jgi:hypothetical protein